MKYVLNGDAYTQNTGRESVSCVHLSFYLRLYPLHEALWVVAAIWYDGSMIADVMHTVSSGGDRGQLTRWAALEYFRRAQPHLAINGDTVIAWLSPADNGYSSDLAVQRHGRRHAFVVPNLHSHALAWINNHNSYLTTGNHTWLH